MNDVQSRETRRMMGTAVAFAQAEARAQAHYIETGERGSAPPPRPTARLPRNGPCPCGNGKKYKFCHGTRRAEPVAAGQG